MAKMPRALLEWRERRPGRVMRRATFERIRRAAARRGARDPEAVAGAAYWRAARAKFRRARRRQGRD